MQYRRILHTGAASALALGLSLCLLGNAQAAPNLSGFHSSASTLSTQAPQITPWQQLVVHSGDTLSGLFMDAGVILSQSHALLALGHETQALNDIHPGDILAIRKTPTGLLDELRYPISSTETLKVIRSNGKLVASVEKQPTQKHKVTVSGFVDGSLLASLTDDGVPSGIAKQVAQVFKHRISLTRLHKGDEFSVIYRVIDSGNKRIASGPLIAARLTTNHKVYQAFRALDSNGHYGYFDADGKSYKPVPFTRKPVSYTRISSPFNPHRLNPVTHRISPHDGVDLAAPAGTPIHAAANGTVKYAGWMHGYGRIVELKHVDGYGTRYAHMRKIARGIKVGTHVSKGQVIGYVGQTGRATGPHLHFEIRRHGVAYNPLTVKLPQGHQLPAHKLAAFEHKIHPLIAKLSPAPPKLLGRDVASSHTSGHCTGNAASGHGFVLLNTSRADKDPDAQNVFCLAHHQS